MIFLLKSHRRQSLCILFDASKLITSHWALIQPSQGMNNWINLYGNMRTKTKVTFIINLDFRKTKLRNSHS